MHFFLKKNVHGVIQADKILVQLMRSYFCCEDSCKLSIGGSLNKPHLAMHCNSGMFTSPYETA